MWNELSEPTITSQSIVEEYYDYDAALGAFSSYGNESQIEIETRVKEIILNDFQTWQKLFRRINVHSLDALERFFNRLGMQWVLDSIANAKCLPELNYLARKHFASMSRHFLRALQVISEKLLVKILILVKARLEFGATRSKHRTPLLLNPAIQPNAPTY
jgi:hypothetical protein